MEYEILNENKNGDKLPNQKELEKELSEYLSKKYGNRIKIISPFLYPKAEKGESQEEGPGEEGNGAPVFDMLPEELEAYLDSFVVKQNQAKAVLGTKICTHFNRISHLKKREGKQTVGVGMIKNNVLMIGPTGVGKTYIIKLIAQKIGVPFVKGDATKFSETGYVGGDVEDLVRDLVHEANDDIDLAENGIVYIDEIDKIASSHNIIGHDVSRTGVQRALLKPMEETDVDLKVPHDAVSQIQAIEHYRRTGKKEKRVVNTKNILFIMSGAFGELGEIIKKRLQKQGIGFEADVRPSEVPWEILKDVTAQDLIEFGFETEFVGRLPVIVVFDELSKDDLVEILRNPNNPVILSKRQDFMAYGIDIKFEEAALEKIAEIAEEQRTGARGLVSAIEKVLIPFEKRLPSTQIRKLLVTKELVDNPEGELASLMAHSNDPDREARYELATVQERKDIEAFIQSKADDFHQLSGLEMNEVRISLMADIYMKTTSDVNTAIEDLVDLHRQIRDMEESLRDKLEISVSIDEDAADELMRKSIETGEDVGAITFQILKKLEYGLKLVKDRSGKDQFIVNKDAVVDMEGYINRFVQELYK
jgi:endopeptidase Clp ATP-binding regulatory subunit ClpX